MKWIAVSTAGMLLLAGCSSSSEDSAESGAAGEAMVAPEPAQDMAADTEFAGSDDRGLNLAASDREVITSGSVSMTVDDPESVARELSRVVEGLGGWVEGLSQQAGTDGIDPSARLVVRIPSRDVSSTLERLETLGTVENVTLDRTDVTMQVRDIEARIRALQVSVARMEDLLARATSTTDLVNAEQMLTSRQSELESMLSQQALLADQVSMSTLEIQLWTVESAPEPEPEPASGFWAGLVNGWNAFLDAGEVALTVLGTLVPWLVFAALVTVAVMAIRRPYKRRQAAKALPAASSGPMTTLPPMMAPVAQGPGQPPYGYPAPAAQPRPAPQAPPTAPPGPGTTAG